METKAKTYLDCPRRRFRSKATEFAGFPPALAPISASPRLPVAKKEPIRVLFKPDGLGDPVSN